MRRIRLVGRLRFQLVCACVPMLLSMWGILATRLSIVVVGDRVDDKDAFDDDGSVLCCSACRSRERIAALQRLAVND